MVTIKILHLFPKLLNIYGEHGNLKVLCSLLEKNSVKTEVVEYERGDLSLDGIDFVYVGAGTERRLVKACELLALQSDVVKAAIDSGVIFLATGGAHMLFGESVSYKDSLYKACGIFPYHCIFGGKIAYDKREVGDSLYKWQDYDIVGYINRKFEFHDIESPLFTLTKGICDSGKVEGFWDDKFFGTSLIGPILAINPTFLEHISSEILKRRGFPMLNKIALDSSACTHHNKRVALLLEKL